MISWPSYDYLHIHLMCFMCSNTICKNSNIQHNCKKHKHTLLTSAGCPLCGPSGRGRADRTTQLSGVLCWYTQELHTTFRNIPHLTTRVTHLDRNIGNYTPVLNIFNQELKKNIFFLIILILVLNCREAVTFSQSSMSPSSITWTSSPSMIDNSSDWLVYRMEHAFG